MGAEKKNDVKIGKDVEENRGREVIDGSAGLAQRGTNDTAHKSEAQLTTSYRHSGRCGPVS